MAKGRYWLSPFAVLADPQRCHHRQRARNGDYYDSDKVVECNFIRGDDTGPQPRGILLVAPEGAKA